MIFLNDLKSKDFTINLITKKNNKLLNENKVYKTQLEQYSQQIKNLYDILKQKNQIIGIYRQKEIGFNNDKIKEKEFRQKKEDLSLENNNNIRPLSDISKEGTLNNTYNCDNNTKNNKLTQIVSLEDEINISKNKISSLNNRYNLNNNSRDNSYPNNNNANNLINNDPFSKLKNGENIVKIDNSRRAFISPLKKRNKDNNNMVERKKEEIINNPF